MKEWYVFINGNQGIYELIVKSITVNGALRKANAELKAIYGSDYKITSIREA